jgi:hypothetical protein
MAENKIDDLRLELGIELQRYDEVENSFGCRFVKFMVDNPLYVVLHLTYNICLLYLLISIHMKYSIENDIPCNEDKDGDNYLYSFLVYNYIFKGIISITLIIGLIALANKRCVEDHIPQVFVGATFPCTFIFYLIPYVVLSECNFPELWQLHFFAFYFILDVLMLSFAGILAMHILCSCIYIKYYK